jgi:hypothetical protein
MLSVAREKWGEVSAICIYISQETSFREGWKLAEWKFEPMLNPDSGSVQIAFCQRPAKTVKESESVPEEKPFRRWMKLTLGV